MRFGAAQRSIYMEAQYFTAPRVGDVLAESLARPQGPELVIIVRRLFTSKMEGFVMGGNQKRLVQRLRRATVMAGSASIIRWCRRPTATCRSPCIPRPIIIDDDFVRVGSSNMDNRSTALDTELDLAIEADDPKRRRTIAGLRDKLIAEHLDSTPQAVRDDRRGGRLAAARHREAQLQASAVCGNCPDEGTCRRGRFSAPGC